MTTRARTEGHVRLLLSTAAILGVLLAVSGTAVAESPQEAVGFTPNHILSSGAFGESIDEMNGGVNLSIPLSPVYRVGPRLSYQLTLAYGSHIWQVKDLNDTLGAIPRLTRNSPFGAGFSLHLGRIEPRLEFDPIVKPHAFAYISPDGASHPIGGLSSFGSTLDTSVTEDGTFIRAQAFRNELDPNRILSWILTFPDSTTAHFVPDPADINGRTFRVDYLQGPPEEPTEAGPPFRVDVTYEAPPVLETPEDNPATPTSFEPGKWRCIHHITDSLQRTIQFTNVATPRGGRTTHISQPIFDPTPADFTPPTATWSFLYDGPRPLTAPDASRTEGDHDLLTEVSLPAPASAVLLGFAYNDVDNGPITDGMLRRRFLPRQAGDPSYYCSTSTTPTHSRSWSTPATRWPTCCTAPGSSGQRLSTFKNRGSQAPHGRSTPGVGCERTTPSATRR